MMQCAGCNLDIADSQVYSVIIIDINDGHLSFHDYSCAAAWAVAKQIMHMAKVNTAVPEAESVTNYGEAIGANSVTLPTDPLVIETLTGASVSCSIGGTEDAPETSDVNTAGNISVSIPSLGVADNG